jgi:hypothetical protein
MANMFRFGTHIRFADEDPREALLKYAAAAEDDPMWVGKGEDSATGVDKLKISNSTTFSSLQHIKKHNPKPCLKRRKRNQMTNRKEAKSDL